MKHISATDARKKWFDLIELAGKPGSFVSIKHRDLPDVVLMSSDEFEGWMETMEIMADPVLVREIQCGLRDMQKGKKKNLSDLKKLAA